MNERKKHRTVDCDLNDPDQFEREQSSLLPSSSSSSSSNNNNNAEKFPSHDLILKPADLQQRAGPVDPNDQLSKLTFSSSLHQLNDSKYLNNNPHNNNNNINLVDHAADSNPSELRRRQPIPSENPSYDANADADPRVRRPAATTNPTTTTTTTPTTMTMQTTHDQTNAAPKPKREAKLDTVHVVVGNEACDLDSTVSCLLMFHIISKMSDEINGKDKTRTLYIPLLNTTRDMLDSKSEVLWFLEKTLNIDKSFLTCKDDIDWAEIKKNGVEVLITLVDHNYSDEFKDIGKIVEIIDHHQVQNSQWLMDNHSSIRLTLDTSVGSCTTLVAERLFYIYAEHHVSDEILLLIYGTVLLDTICLSEKAKRFTRRDVYLLKKLDALLGSKKPVRHQLYRQIVEVKNSARELNFEKLMKRDLKVYKDKHGMRVGIASLFGMAAKEALGLAANIDLDLFFRQNQYEAFIIMGLIADLDHSDSISRDLVLISANGRLFDELQGALEADGSKLDLTPVGSNSSPDPEDNVINNKRIVDSTSDQSTSKAPLYKARIWLQRNVSSSRKVVAPLVLKVLHDGV